MAGSLTVVGTGIMMVAHITLEAQGHIEAADKVYYLTTDPVTEEWIRERNDTAESLQPFYGRGETRLDSYIAMTEQICSPVREGKEVVAVFYGHPGVFVFPSHAAIRQLRSEGHPARMLPGVSAEDCMFADIGFDPATPGCLSYEATDFLVHRRPFDPRCHLVLWQVGVIGDVHYKRRYDTESGMRFLVARLADSIDPAHQVAIYEAARYPVCPPRVDWQPLSELPQAELTPISTLYIPPSQKSEPDQEAMAALGIPRTYPRARQEAAGDARFAFVPGMR